MRMLLCFIVCACGNDDGGNGTDDAMHVWRDAVLSMLSARILKNYIVRGCVYGFSACLVRKYTI